MSQDQLAARVGVSRKWMGEFEAGQPGAQLRLVLSVLDALGLTLALGPREASASTAEGTSDLDALLDDYQRG